MPDSQNDRPLSPQERAERAERMRPIYRRLLDETAFWVSLSEIAWDLAFQSEYPDTDEDLGPHD